jgi:hypothetical protein
VWYPGSSEELYPGYLGREHIRNSYHIITVAGDIEGTLEYWGSTNWDIREWIPEAGFVAEGVGWGPHKFVGTWQGDSSVIPIGTDVEFEGHWVLKFRPFPLNGYGKFTSHGSGDFDGMLLKGTVAFGAFGLGLSGVIKG